ncbi:MAG: hypothetical protein MHM6MM_004614 [Cercozoa sp. M6MM]
MSRRRDALGRWQMRQCFGGQSPDVVEGDLVTAVQFDHNGDYLAVGDKGGRIWIYESMDCDASSCQLADESAEERLAERRRGIEFRFYGQFQSHEAEFDYLKSLEIEEKINMIRWCRRTNESLILLATNDKTVKLWKIYERKVRDPEGNQIPDVDDDDYDEYSLDQVRIPDLSEASAVTAATPRRVFANAHTYNINSVSLNSDGETFISADDLRINMWSLDRADSCFNVVDIKPPNMEDLQEVITSATFHESHCHQFAYATSRGTVKLCDLRQRALSDGNADAALTFEAPEDAGDRTFFTEILASISDISFSGEHFLVARDYLSVKVWDVRMQRTPVSVIRVHEHLQDRLCELYDNDSIFDKFEVATQGSLVVTGSYDDAFVVADWSTGDKVSVKAQRHGHRVSHSVTSMQQIEGIEPLSDSDAEVRNPSDDAFTKKTLNVAWHPTVDAVAVASLNNLFIYQSPVVEEYDPQLHST